MFVINVGFSVIFVLIRKLANLAKTTVGVYNYYGVKFGGKTMFHMTRSINPVGQGAFYSEKIKIHNHNDGIFNIVYDCGSVNINALTNEIHGVFKKDTIIDAVFLSHFDSDHVNGFDSLLKHCKIRKLFIPLLNNKDKKLVLLSLLCSGLRMESSIYNLVEGDLSFFIQHQIEVIAISAEDDDIKNQKGDNRVIYLGEEQTPFNYGYQIVASGSEVTLFVGFDWVWIPFNFKSKERHQAFIDALNTNDIIIDDTTNVFDLWHNHKTTLKRIYKKEVPGDINTNSMVVYSGPVVTTRFNMRALSFECYKGHSCIVRYPYYDLLGCMYLGDYDASDAEKWDCLVDAYRSYLHMVGVWQLPHHGSILSYNEEIAKRESEFYFCSASVKNKYHHPSGYVVIDILLNDKEFLQIDETIGSRVVFTIGHR